MTLELDAARRLVAASGPGDVRDRILAFLDDHPDALHRSCAEGHLTGSALVVDPRASRALLMLHRKLGKWLQMGGHADGDGDLARVALREVAEESGLADARLTGGPVDLDVHRVEPPGELAHLHLDVRFVAVVPPEAVPVANHESRELRWFPLVELAHGADEPGMRRLAAAALAYCSDRTRP
jgi:8-oxo-dGTP pyrophosphatase MutT (NUDIX family)